MCRATGAVFVRFEQLPEEARNFIEKCRNAALVADVGASCGVVVRLFRWFRLFLFIFKLCRQLPIAFCDKGQLTLVRNFFSVFPLTMIIIK